MYSVEKIDAIIANFDEEGIPKDSIGHCIKKG